MAPLQPVAKTLLPLEVAVFSGQDAIRAQRHGAHRIELNATGSYDQGGLTPRVDELQSIAAHLAVPVRIMIRPCGPPPTGCDFVYSAAEFAAMRQAIVDFKAADVLNPVRGDGFVFGVLSAVDDPSRGPAVDLDRCRQLVDLARPLACVFHRAFDPLAASALWRRGVDAVADCGFEAVLTSGGPGRVHDNLARVVSICRHASSRGLQVVVGGGVRHRNAPDASTELAQLRYPNIWMHAACAVKSDKSPHAELDAGELIMLIGSLSMAVPD